MTRAQAEMIGSSSNSHSSAGGSSSSPARRSPWRQSLCEAERGFALGLRSGSSLFIELFCVTCLLAGAGVLGLAAWQWVAMVLSLSLAGVAELFFQAFEVLVKQTTNVAPDTTLHADPPGRQCALRLATAGCLLARLSVVVVTLLLFTQRIRELTADTSGL